MTIEEYKKDPCGASSLPYWKTREYKAPDGIVIVREDGFFGVPAGYGDEKYFKLVHRLKGLEKMPVPHGFTLAEPTEEELSRHIALCYEEERLSAEELIRRSQSPQFFEGLRIGLIDEAGELAASGIAELDRETGEGVLEWIQVSPALRRRGLGSLLVSELLMRLAPYSEFVTVSGKAESPSSPRELYISRGFGEEVVWHVMRKKEPPR